MMPLLSATGHKSPQRYHPSASLDRAQQRRGAPARVARGGSRRHLAACGSGHDEHVDIADLAVLGWPLFFPRDQLVRGQEPIDRPADLSLVLADPLGHVVFLRRGPRPADVLEYLGLKLLR